MKTQLTYPERQMLIDIVIISECNYKIDKSLKREIHTAEKYVSNTFKLMGLNKKMLSNVFKQAVEDIKLSCNL